jgi:hypothetical protein
VRSICRILAGEPLLKVLSWLSNNLHTYEDEIDQPEFITALQVYGCSESSNTDVRRAFLIIGLLYYRFSVIKEDKSQNDIKMKKADFTLDL